MGTGDFQMRTIKDIAQMAGVSRTTVSRVLNDSGYVSEKARKKVLEVIEETGYVPRQHAKSLRTKETKIIGVILPKISTDTSSRTVDGMNEVFGEKGYQILLTSTNLDKAKEIEHLRLLQSGQVEGVVLRTTHADDDLISEKQSSEAPVVVIGQELPDDSGRPSVVFDDYRAPVKFMQALIGSGRRKIGYVGVEETAH